MSAEGCATKEDETRSCSMRGANAVARPRFVCYAVMLLSCVVVLPKHFLVVQRQRDCARLQRASASPSHLFRLIKPNSHSALYVKKRTFTKDERASYENRSTQRKTKREKRKKNKEKKKKRGAA